MNSVGLWQRPFLLLSFAALMWSSNFIIARSIPASVSPVSLSFWRWIFAAAFSLPLALPHLSRDFPIVRQRWLPLLLLAATGLAGANTLAYIALRGGGASATMALLLMSAIPTTTLLIGAVLYRNRIVPRQVVAIALGLCGVAFIVAQRANVNGSATGLTLLLVAMLLQATYAASLKKRPPVHPLTMLFVTVAFSAIIMLPVQLAWGSPFPLGESAPTAAILYLALGPSLLAFFCFNRGVELVGAPIGSSFMYLMPVFGSLIAIPTLHEWPGIGELIGFGVIGIGFFIMQRGNGAMSSPAMER